MNVELLGKLRNGSIALDGSKRHLRLEGQAFVPETPLYRGISCAVRS
jgi:hypothetical protein